MKFVAAACAAVLVIVASSPAALGQTAPAPPPSEPPTTTATSTPPPSVPPGLPVVTPPTVPSTDPEAPPPEPEPPLPDPSPQVAVVMAKLTLLNAQRVLDLAQAAFMASSDAEAKVRGARDAAQHDYDIKRGRLTDAVSNAYVRGTNVSGSVAGLSAEDYVPRASERLLVGTAIQRDHEEVQTATARLQSAQQALAQATARRSQTQMALDVARSTFDDANETLRNAGRLTSARDVSPEVMGDPVLTADEIVAWYRSEGVVGYAAGVDLPTLAGLYIDEGKAEHIRGDIAFAQSIVETGAFTSPLTTHNNFAGIGACDTCATGFDFPSPLMGVRAQAQLLHAYSDRTVRTKTLANPAIGSDPDTLSVRGCCATWNALTGTWASDPNYGPKLMTVYLSMLEFTLVARTQAANT